MEPVEIKPGIYWVGGIDWDVRNFHGYLTQRGATYNAYLIMDEKVVPTSSFRSKAILVGSPTLNNGIFPPVAAFLIYLKGLRPKDRIVFAFGSYGWGGQAVKEMEAIMSGLGWDMPVEGVKIQYIPDEEELEKVKEAGKKLGEVI